MTTQEIQALRIKYGIPINGVAKPTQPTTPVDNTARLAELDNAWGTNKATGVNRPLPGADSAVLPAKNADGSARLTDIPKVVPNALGDIWNLVKEGTYGTVKKIVYDIPKTAIDLYKAEPGGNFLEKTKNALRDTEFQAPKAIFDTASSLIPQSAKELANTDALAEIPSQFKELVKENGGSYAKALLATIKAMPGAVPDAVQNYANQIDRARQSVENHPVNELLGWLGLKSLAHGNVTPTKLAGDSELLNTPVKDIPSNIKETISEKIPFKDVPGKIVRRVQDANVTNEKLKQQPQPVQTAVKADIPEPQAKLVNDANPTEKGLMNEMLNKHKKGTEELTMTPEERPDAVIGREVMKIVKFLEDQKKTAIKEEGNHVKNLSDKPVDYSRTVNDFKDRLEMLGVKEGEDGRLDFSKSELSTPASAKDRGLLQLTHDELKPNNDLGVYQKPASELHTIRQRLFNETQNKNFTEPFTDRIVSMVHNDQGTSVRSGLLHDISNQAGASGVGYEATATKNAIINNALQTFYKLIGKDAGTRETNIKNLGVGEVANRLEGNASAKDENAFQKIEDAASKYGFSNDVSIRKLAAFKTILKNILGETQHNSLAGGVEQGSRAALPMEAADVAGNVLSGKVGGTIKAVGNFIKSNTKAEQIRALQELLGNPDIKTVKTKKTPPKVIERLYNEGNPF